MSRTAFKDHEKYSWVFFDEICDTCILKYVHIHIFVDPAAGASDDWYKGVLKARFAYTIELRDTGRHGFVLPADQIKPSGEELWEAQRVVLQKMVDVSSE